MRRTASLFTVGISTLLLATFPAKAQTNKQFPVKYEPNLAHDDLGQITNANSLPDIAPTDWAYEALRNLVDRYFYDLLPKGNNAGLIIEQSLNRVDAGGAFVALTKV